MLGGIIQSILAGITGVIMAIVTPILDLILDFVNRFIIGPLIQLAFNLLSYSISLLFYDIACFILALIDYVEMMFRLLAGLEVDGVTLNLSNSPDKGSDLVVQLIRTPEVRDIFLAMVVVGMFLLIITTIFQMIKVEYTTEGAKNAKGPILNKAFKGLANMILLPALCIFGVVLGNQVLDLLDKATKPDSDIFGQSATISGTLFVAAAAEAHYQKGDFRVVFISPTPSLALMELPINIVPILINSIFEAWGDAFNADDQKNYLFPDAVRKESESLVASGTISYWNIAAISQIYDYSKINYLLLIFGGCIVIKTLYYTCFGMIVRLYQCGMLFIISPAVIGMSPVNESGLGKWRSEFIGQAISAYGVVLALNIFFVLVRVLLSIDFSFEGVTGYFFGAGLMEGLLKAIIVMGGTLTIEKFSKEIGGYFGAKDALSQGKEMEKAVGDVAKKAISTAISVAMMATGVGGAAVGGLKAAGAAAKAAGGGMKGLAAGAKSIGGKLGNKVMDTGANIAQSFVDMSGADVDIAGKWQQHKHNKAQAHLTSMNAQRDAAKDSFSAAGSDYAAKDVAFRKADETYQRALKQDVRDPEVLARLKSKRDTALEERDEAKTTFTSAGDRWKAASKVAKTAADDAKLAEFSADKRQAQHASERLIRSGAARQAGKAFFEEKTFFGQAFAAGKKQVGGYEKAYGEEYGKEAKSAYDHLAKVKSDAKEEAHDVRNKETIKAKNVILGSEMVDIFSKNSQAQKRALQDKAEGSIAQVGLLKSRIGENGDLTRELQEKEARFLELGKNFDEKNAQHRAIEADYQSAKARVDNATNQIDQMTNNIANEFNMTIQQVEQFSDAAALNDGKVQLPKSVLDQFTPDYEKMSELLTAAINKEGVDISSEAADKIVQGVTSVTGKKVTADIAKVLTDSLKELSDKIGSSK